MRAQEYYKTTPEYVKHKDMFDFYAKNREYIENNLAGFKDTNTYFYDWVIFKEDYISRFIRNYNDLSLLISFKGKEMNELNTYLFKNVAQNDYPNGLDFCIKKFKIKFKESKEKLFNYLDKKENPYEHIYYPFYCIDIEMEEKGYYPYKTAGGINDLTNFVAHEYAMYKLGYDNIN